MSVTRSQMNALLKRLEGPLREAYLIAVQSATGRAKIARLAEALVAGNMDDIALAAGVREGMWSTLTEGIRSAYLTSGILVAIADVPKRYGLEFDINNPRAEEWLRRNSSALVTGNLNPEQRAAIQVMMSDGFAKGKNPVAIALDIVGRIGPTGRRAGGVIGLTQQQAKFVTNMMDDLENLNSRYFTRRLRDRRFDSTVRESMEAGKPLAQKTRNKIVSRYEDRMLKHRGDNIARTEALGAMNAAADEALNQIVEEGLAPRNAVVRIWRHSFSANERAGHLLMNNQRRGIDQFFTNPITAASLIRPGTGPASEVINCRCFLEHEIDFFAVERAA